MSVSCVFLGRQNDAVPKLRSYGLGALPFQNGALACAFMSQAARSPKRKTDETASTTSPRTLKSGESMATTSSRTPLRRVKNFGPVTSAELESIGLVYMDQLEALGFEDTCRKWVEFYPERLNANAFLGIICALEQTVWTKATPDQRAQAHGMVKLLRQEYKLPPAKPKRKLVKTGAARRGLRRDKN